MRLQLLLENGRCQVNYYQHCKNGCCYFTCYCAIALLLLRAALLPCRVEHRGKLPSTVRFKTTRGKTASMGLGDLSLHVKQFMRASAQAIGQKEGICRASLTNRRNNRGRMQEGCRNRVNDSHANGEQAGERGRYRAPARTRFSATKAHATS